MTLEQVRDELVKLLAVSRKDKKAADPTASAWSSGIRGRARGRNQADRQGSPGGGLGTDQGGRARESSAVGTKHDSVGIGSVTAENVDGILTALTTAQRSPHPRPIFLPTPGRCIFFLRQAMVRVEMTRRDLLRLMKQPGASLAGVLFAWQRFPSWHGVRWR